MTRQPIGHVACIMCEDHIKVYALWSSGDFLPAIEQCFREGAAEVVTEWKGHYYVCTPQEAGTYQRTEIAPSDPRTIYLPTEASTVLPTAPRKHVLQR